MRLALQGAALAALGLTLAWSGGARADVVASPPLFCGPGKTPVSDHHGSRCEANAPDCPPGWKGVLGGKCILHVCKADAECGASGQCVAADVCGEERPLHWEYARPAGGEPSREPGPAQEPPPAPDPSRPVWVAIEPCSEARACPGAATCRAVSVCLPRGAARPAPKPSNADVQRGTIPVAARRGCGCDAAGAAGGSVAALAAVAIAAAAIARRRLARSS